jgi:farnesyl diphosphate synthase
MSSQDLMPVLPRAAPQGAATGFEAWMQAELHSVESALEAWVPADAPAGLGEAMRYGVLDGGKRLRPLLVLASCQALQGAADAALRAAVAVELIHAYSLVHDDMPCMDNDVLRRGKPTVHVKYGQAQAMLAGDAMQALAFEVLTPLPGESAGIEPALQARLSGLLARAAGHAGMAGGQAIDLASIGRPLDEDALRDMHRRKTGALLQASVLMGASCGRPDAAAWRSLADYGAAVGLAFQVVDDILDVTQASETLGKTAGKDIDSNKPTYVSVLGLAAARQHAQDLRLQAHAALTRGGPPNSELLAVLADMVVERDS